MFVSGTSAHALHPPPQQTLTPIIMRLWWQELHVFEVEMLRLPKSAILERSDDGETFEPYQYYAFDCEDAFDLTSDA